MDITRYLFARKCGIPKYYALILALISGGKTKTLHLLLSDGGRLLIGGYGEDTLLAIQPKEVNNA